MDKKKSRQNDDRMKFIIDGLYSSGKTCLLHRLKFDEIIETHHSFDIDIQQLTFDGLETVGWDMGGRQRIRRLYQLSYTQSAGLIYVIDSTNVDKLDENLEELNFIFKCEELENKVVMVLANKQDLEGAMKPEKIEAELKKKCSIGLNMTVLVMPCSVVTKEGMWEAFARFVKLAQEKSKKGKKVLCGLIPHAWEISDQELEGYVKTVGEKDTCPKMLHKIKKSLSLFKSALFS